MTERLASRARSLSVGHSTSSLSFFPQERAQYYLPKLFDQNPKVGYHPSSLNIGFSQTVSKLRALTFDTPASDAVAAVDPSKFSLRLKDEGALARVLPSNNGSPAVSVSSTQPLRFEPEHFSFGQVCYLCPSDILRLWLAIPRLPIYRHDHPVRCDRPLLRRCVNHCRRTRPCFLPRHDAHSSRLKSTLSRLALA